MGSCKQTATVSCLVLVALSIAVMTCAAATTPEGPPSLAAARATAPPAIDGLLDDPCWAEATHIDAFWRERVDAPELERTEAWMACDSDALYLAFRCHDSQPARIEANQHKRQGNIGDDDWVAVALDVEDLGVNFYQFRLTPTGTQWDSVPGGTSEKIQWRGDWRGAARIEEAGWTAEMAIPFSILRYAAGQNCFRLTLERRLARENDLSAWPQCYARRHDAAECARWTGLATPSPSFRYVLMPYLLTVASENEDDRERVTGGLDFKGTLPNGLVAMGAYNPDFRNIEDVVETIDFTFTERWLPEYRPFFREGSDYFPGSTLFYSRRIGELDYGAKLFGTLGQETIGILNAYRRGGENHFVARYAHHFSETAHAGFGFVDRSLPGEPDNRALGINANWDWISEGGGTYAWGRRHGSSTQGDGGDGYGIEYGFGAWREQGLNWFFNTRYTAPDFYPADGYVPETGIRNTSVGVHHHLSYDDSSVLNTSQYLHFNFGHSEAGSRRQVWMEHDVEWRNGRSIWVGGDIATRDGLGRDSYYLGTGWNNRDFYHSGSVDYMGGERLGQDYRFLRFSQAFRPTTRWSADFHIERRVAATTDWQGAVLPPEGLTQYIITTTYDIGPERTASARLVRHGDDSNVYAAYRQRVRQGMDLLVVAGDPNAPEWVRRLAVKAIWCY